MNMQNQATVVRLASRQQSSVSDVVPGKLEPIASDELSSLLQLLYQEAMESPPWAKTFEMLRERLGCLHLTMLIRPLSSDNPGTMMVTGDNVTEQGTASYKSHFFALDPFVRLPPARQIL